MRPKLLTRCAPLALVLALSTAGCSLFRAPPPLTPDTAYQRGMAAYEARRFGRAAELLQTWADASAGDARLPEGLYALARARMETDEQLMAATTFLRIVTEYPAHARQEDARFGVCEAYRTLSPRTALDQQNTETALLYCGSYVEYYGQTARSDRARLWVAELRDKLARKQYEAGMWYFRRGAFDASVIYFQRAATEYPDTPTAPQALLQMALAYDRVGYKEEAQEARAKLRSSYPQSPEARTLPPA
ncbi:MAG TPA: outer membrane protein assembly factor BamD [Longimicrobium sp.]|nr:outer membrane protein assembly factor BamD [Longimicrobium sp.]